MNYSAMPSGKSYSFNELANSEIQGVNGKTLLALHLIQCKKMAPILHKEFLTMWYKKLLTAYTHTSLSNKVAGK